MLIQPKIFIGAIPEIDPTPLIKVTPFYGTYTAKKNRLPKKASFCRRHTHQLRRRSLPVSCWLADLASRIEVAVGRGKAEYGMQTTI